MRQLLLDRLELGGPATQRRVQRCQPLLLRTARDQIGRVMGQELAELSVSIREVSRLAKMDG